MDLQRIPYLLFINKLANFEFIRKTNLKNNEKRN